MLPALFPDQMSLSTNAESKGPSVLDLQVGLCSFQIQDHKRVLGSLLMLHPRRVGVTGILNHLLTSLLMLSHQSICVTKSMRWWEKTLKSNMVEIHSAQGLVDSLLNAGNRLAIIDFYSPGCGGCKALHPKLCQIAETNPDAIFLKVNYEELRTMCESLHIHVLPFFRFYRGAEGRVCSFSCTNATIKKFKDALGKYGDTGRSILGPAKGLDDSELLNLFSAGQLAKSYASTNKAVGYVALQGMDLHNPLSKDENKLELEESNSFLLS